MTAKSGTSMACPVVAGAALLARQYLSMHHGIPSPSSALVSAVLANTARGLTGHVDVFNDARHFQSLEEAGVYPIHVFQVIS